MVDVKAIRERWEKATPGPYEVSNGFLWANGDLVLSATYDGDITVDDDTFAALAASWADVRDALSEVDRLKAQLAAARKTIRESRRCGYCGARRLRGRWIKMVPMPKELRDG